jgi:hypothetical protein
MMRGTESASPNAAAEVTSGYTFLDRIDGYMLMMSYISPFATACCTVATPSLRLAFSV